MKSYITKIHNADRAAGQVVNLAIVERIFDDEGKPLSDAIIGAVDCRILEAGTHWSNQPAGESGRWYVVEPLRTLPTPSRLDSEILIGI